MDKSTEKIISTNTSIKAINTVLDNKNCIYMFGGLIICYIINKIIDSQYTFESTIDANLKTLKFNIAPYSAN